MYMYVSDEAEKAMNNYRGWLYDDNEKAQMWMNIYIAFSEHAAKLTLLLNTENENGGKKDG